MDIGQLFCEIDDFFLDFEKQQVSEPLPDTETSNKRNRPSKLHTSEVMTILVVFHQSDYRTFKQYYLQKVREELRWAFPHLVSYSRFVECAREALVPL